VGHIAERTQRSSAGPAAEHDPGEGDGDRAGGEGEGQDPQGVSELLEREHLEIGRSDHRDRDAHSHLQRTGEAETLARGRARGDLAPEVCGDGVPTDGQRGGEPPAAVVEDRA
jgi:hypothetical protein